MAIQSGDIKLRESERMTDTTDGGGRRSSRVVLDGVAGNVFPKVSRVDSVYGRVNLRKLYGHVDTANTDVYAGAHAIITDAPDNGRIHVCAFSTRSDFDTRRAARDFIESYVIAGPVSRMTLYGLQLAGITALLAYQKIGEPLPEIGEVFAIATEGAGGSTAATPQYCRVQDLAHEERTFTDTSGPFSVRVITLGIGAPLLAQYQGIDSPSRISADRGSAVLRTTRVADAARYFGIQRLAGAAAAGALTVSVPSIYTPIVPTTQRETALSLVSPTGASMLLPASASTLELSMELPVSDWPAGTSYVRLLRAAVPGSVTLKVAGYAAQGNSTVLDDGAGNFSAFGSADTALSAVVDYDTGTVAISHGAYSAGALISVTYMPAGAASQTAHTDKIGITIGTRGSVYTPPLVPTPAPGTLIVDYRALGKWYRLRDTGRGVLAGSDPAYGTGVVNYVTGGTIITLGALPDVGSDILLSWGSPVHYEVLTAAPASDATVQLDAFPVRPGSLVLTWTSGGSAKTAADNAAGAIAGDAVGVVNYQTGVVHIKLAAAVLGTVSIAYDKASAPSEGVSSNLGGPVTGRSVYVDGIYLTLPGGAVTTVALRAEDDGAGKLKVANLYGPADALSPLVNNYMQPWSTAAHQDVGTVDYASGVVSMSPTVPVVLESWTGSAWTQVAGLATVQNSGQMRFGGVPVGAAAVAEAQTQSVRLGTPDAGVSLVLAGKKPLSIVANSLVFSIFGKLHVDRNGVVYTNIDASTGAGTPVGTINYGTGVVVLDTYPDGTAPAFSLVAGLGKRGSYTITDAFFRSAGAPLRPASAFVQVTTIAGDLLSASSDQNGIISGPSISGVVDQTTGVFSVTFENAEGPRQVLPETLRYSAVALTNLPLNASILGLDPVRLPSDGRVPIYRAADVTTIHHTDVLSLGTPVPGATHSVGRADLSALWLQDAKGAKLPLSLYTPNLQAGTVTIAADAVFTGLTMPIEARHRIEEMGLLTDVQINGQLSFAAPLLRDYPVGSCVSSALLFGDLFARVSGVFDQATWTGKWSDALIGDQATAQFNDVDYPIEVLNDAATSERWRLNFTSPTAYQIIGEQLGVIATGTTSADVQPINLLTGKAYFTVRKNGFGAGWVPGNQLRFNTVGATPPFWLARTVLPGATLAGDSFDAQLRGDVD